MTARPMAAMALGVVLAFSAAAAAADPEAEWRAWREKTEASYSTDRLAVLKVNDAVFLRPGQSAYLIGTEGDPAGYRWSLEPVPEAILHVSFAQKEPGTFSARLTHGEKQLDVLALLAEHKRYPVTGAIDVTGRVTGEGTEDPRLQLKIFNQEHDAAKAFKGLDFFDYAPGFRFTATFEPEAEPQPVILDTERGLRKRFYRHGTARFSIEGKTVRMPLYDLAAEPDAVHGFFTLFTDHTTGKETYGVGRYLDVALPGKETPKQVVIDFNRAYNPLCARSKHYNCPLVEMEIPAAIRAGEKAPAKPSVKP